MEKHLKERYFGELYDLVTEYQYLRELPEDEWKKAIDGFKKLDNDSKNLLEKINAPVLDFSVKNLTDEETLKMIGGTYRSSIKSVSELLDPDPDFPSNNIKISEIPTYKGVLGNGFIKKFPREKM